MTTGYRMQFHNDDKTDEGCTNQACTWVYLFWNGQRLQRPFPTIQAARDFMAANPSGTTEVMK